MRQFCPGSSDSGTPPRYVGMDPNRFNDDVRPYLIEIPIGKQGVAFDRLDLDACRSI